MGFYSYSVKNHAHRRAWIAQHLQQLAEVFGIEVFTYAVMSNHLHLVLRNRPDRVLGWSDEQVARRWCALFPKRDASRMPLPLTEEALAGFLADPRRVETCRERLADISWFMRCLNEPIARRADWLQDLTGPESPFTGVDTAYYLSLVEWTGRSIRQDKPGYLPVHLQPVLDRFDLDTENWVKNVERYGGLFYRLAGTVEQILQRAREKGHHWLRGRSGSEQLYRKQAKAA